MICGRVGAYCRRGGVVFKRVDIDGGGLEEAVEAEVSRLVLEVPEGAEGRLDQWLSEQELGLSRTSLQRMIRSGRITCDGGVTKPNHAVQPGQRVVVEQELAKPPAAPLPEPMVLDVLYEDSDLIVVNKAAGVVVHPAVGNESGTLINGLLHHCGELAEGGAVERPGVVQRLDRETSGVMVVARSEVAMLGLAGLFKERKVGKEYLALVHGVPRVVEGTVSVNIGRHPVQRQRMAALTRGGREAITHYRTEQQLDGISLVHCNIVTGRTHQIRVHLRSLGSPIVGDSTYGHRRADSQLVPVPQRQMLHALKLSFRHPKSGAEMEFSAPLPEDFVTQLRSAGGII